MNPKVPLPILHHRCRFGSRPAVRTGPWTVERGQSPPPCLSGGRRSTAMFPGLHVTDLTPASGGAYTANREWCLSRGVSVHPMPVSAFDYKHQLKGSGAPQEFDLILCFGLCMGYSVPRILWQSIFQTPVWLGSTGSLGAPTTNRYSMRRLWVRVSAPRMSSATWQARQGPLLLVHSITRLGGVAYTTLPLAGGT